MDVSHDNDWYGRLEVYGVAQPVVYEGSVQRIVMQAMIHMKNVNLRKNRDGTKGFKIEFSSTPFGQDEEDARLAGLSGLDVDMYRLFKQHSTQASDEEMAAIRVPPWNDDEQVKLFRFYMASKSNYQTASPSEIEELRAAIIQRWKGKYWTRNDGVDELFNPEDFVNRRA